MFYFQAKILYKIAFYSWNINKYDPKALIVTSEYSYTSSILTKYCEFSDVEHINVMHGDKLYYIRDSFFKFHKCYVWHKHYVELFCKLSADFNQFVIEIPQKFHIIDDKIKSDNGDGRKIITYYLQTQNEKEMISVRNNLSKLNGSYSIIIRVHPIYTDNRMAEKYSGSIKSV